MDERLKDELREFGLLPVSFDEKAQARYKAIGIDPSKVESHFTPGTPEDILEKQMAVGNNVERLHQLEAGGRTAGIDYNRLVNRIREDLEYIRSKGLHLGSKVAIGGVPLGILAGVNREKLHKSLTPLGFMPEYLRPLLEDKVKRMYGDATSRDGVFRNVLLSLADNDEESTFFKAASIDDIFNRYVRVEGYVTRVGDYRLGPSDKGVTHLTADQLLIKIQTPGTSWDKIYQILDKDQVRFLRNASVSMH